MSIQSFACICSHACINPKLQSQANIFIDINSQSYHRSPHPPFLSVVLIVHCVLINACLSLPKITSCLRTEGKRVGPGRGGTAHKGGWLREGETKQEIGIHVGLVLCQARSRGDGCVSVSVHHSVLHWHISITVGWADMKFCATALCREMRLLAAERLSSTTSANQK